MKILINLEENRLKQVIDDVLKLPKGTSIIENRSDGIYRYLYDGNSIVCVSHSQAYTLPCILVGILLSGECDNIQVEINISDISEDSYLELIEGISRGVKKI